MSIYRSGDLNADINRRLKEEQDWEDSLPHCDCCGEAIDNHVWEINGEILCEDCAVKKHRRSVD